MLRRDERTGEQLLAGLSQMHVEVAVERLHRRFGVDVDLAQPRVPYLETIRTESRARARYKKQTGGRGQFGDCEIVLEPRPGHEGYEFVDKIVGGVIPQSFRPAVDKGIQEAMLHGELAGAPVQGVTVRLVDGQYHNVDSSEMAFKIAGSMAFKDAYHKADPMLLEPIMELEVTVPDEAVGAVNGDLNSRRGRLHGMEPLGGMTTIKAEVPMAEVLTYSQSLTSLTGGPRRLPHVVPALRGSALAHRAEADRGREEGTRVRQGLVVTGASPAVMCAICGRTLLVGEDSTRFSPDGIEYVDVCPLCRGRAVEAGWYREGGSSLPVLPAAPRRGFFARLFGAPQAPAPAVAQPILNRLSPDEQAIAEAVALFNGSSHRRTVEGLMRSLGLPRVAVGPTEAGEIGIVVAWDISWYRYRLSPNESDPVQMIERGFDAAELGPDDIDWNAEVDSIGRLVPRVAPE